MNLGIAIGDIFEDILNSYIVCEILSKISGFDPES